MELLVGTFTEAVKQDKLNHPWNLASNLGTYCQVSNIRHTLVGNKIVDNSDVVGASPVAAAPTASSLST